jgi:Asp-tRNA(Asn)/Glu-tRNA(Gln) amidotransferase A subunit family amidase
MNKKKPDLKRRQMLAGIAASSVVGMTTGSLIKQPATAAHRDPVGMRLDSIDMTSDSIDQAAVANAERLIGLRFTEKQRGLMLNPLKQNLENYEGIRKVPLPHNVPPALLFNPIPVGMKLNSARKPFKTSPVSNVTVPTRLEDLAFYSVGQLAELIRTRKISSQQLTRVYLNRLRKYGPKLECVITLTEDLASRQASRADEELAAGRYRGAFHGIPYGVKDVFAVKGTPTTLGAEVYKDQVTDEDATVIKRLQEAGAVLVAKLSLGELSYMDVWYGGKTRNPWNVKQGSSGSSAGSAAATSAGLVAFAIAAEAWGSIVSPSTRCGVTGLRPTYGRISRNGAAISLIWSMEKIGVICRTVEDCALVLNAIYGPDGEDQNVLDVPFNYSPAIDLSKLRIGYLKRDFEQEKEDKDRKSENELDTSKENDKTALAKLQMLGAQLIPIELPKLPVRNLPIILFAENSATFDELTRSGRAAFLKTASTMSELQRSRFIPAVEYIQASRIRYLLIQEMADLLKDIDVYVAPSLEGDNLLVTNLTGHPCVVVPNGFSKAGTPTSISFIGKLFDEGTVLAVAKKYQDATRFHLRHPMLPD